MQIKQALPAITIVLGIIAAVFLAVSTVINNVKIESVPLGLQQTVVFIKQFFDGSLIADRSTATNVINSNGIFACPKTAVRASMFTCWTSTITTGWRTAKTILSGVTMQPGSNSPSSCRSKPMSSTEPS